MKENFYSNKMLRICLSVALLLMALIAKAGGTSTTYYYRATAGLSPTAGGKVYVATAETPNPSYQSSTMNITGDTNAGSGGATVKFYFYAQANTGYIFKYWAKGSASGDSVDYKEKFTTEETISSTSQNNRTQVTYYAVFEQQTGKVKVYSENTSKGIVSINNSNNAYGDNVTLTATPDVSNGVTFLGWKKGSTSASEYVSTDNPYTFTVSTATEGNYYACFSNPKEKVYIRIQNVKTGRFISIYGNQGASNHTASASGTTYNDGYIFENSLKLIEPTDAQGNPSTVFLRSGNPASGGTTNDADLVAHEISYKEDLVDSDHLLTMQLVSNVNSVRKYKITTTVYVNDNGTQVPFISYLYDEGTRNWAVMKTGDTTDESNLWYVYVLNDVTTEGAFGANTKSKFTKDGKYYTTMFTAFPYELLDGVKAYYLPADVTTSYDEETNTAEFSEVTSGKVPAHTAVILECANVQNDASTEPAVVYNRLRPIVEADEGSVPEIVGETHNLLKGYLSVNGSTKANDKNLMYVLSIKDAKLGFYHYSKDNMSPYKAYLQLPTADVSDAVQNTKFRFGHLEEDETPTSVTLVDRMADDDAPIYDLQGRQVVNAVKGIYIKNGKKFFVK